MYLQGRQFVDPEGILSTIPAVSQVMIGFVCGKIIIDIKDNDRRMLNLFLIGTTLLFAGYLLSYACPLNKRLWSPSFVLLTCGIAALSLALLLYIIDVKQNKKWFSFFEAFGANPLVIYVFSCIAGLCIGISIRLDSIICLTRYSEIISVHLCTVYFSCCSMGCWDMFC